jgi:hypothetical protein
MTQSLSSIPYGRPIPNTVLFKPVRELCSDNVSEWVKNGRGARPMIIRLDAVS